MHHDSRPDLDRRGFLKLGMMGSAVLLGAGLLGSLHGCATHTLKTDRTRPLKVMREKDAAILAAITPVLMKGQFPTEPTARQQAIDRYLVNVDEFLSHSSPYTLDTLRQLFDLLWLGPSRVLMAGLWSDWDSAGDDGIEGFLLDWRDSSLNLFRFGYAQLCQLTSLVYYSTPESWSADLYPGPPQHLPG